MSTQLEHKVAKISQSRWLRLGVLSASLIIWLIPFLWIGSTLGRLPFRVPDLLWQQYNASALFTKRISFWPDWLIEVRLAGKNKWQSVSMTDVSPMPTSGYRQRVDRILGDTRNKKSIAESLRLRLAQHIALRLKTNTGQVISGVRFVCRSWQTNTPDIAAPEGRWNRDVTLPKTTRVTVYGPYRIVDGKSTLEQEIPSNSKTPSQPRVFQRPFKVDPPAKS